MLDSEFSLSIVSTDDLAKWGVDESTVFEQAARNLSAADVVISRQPDDPLVHLVHGPDGYDSSLLRHSKVFSWLTERVGPAVMVAVGRDEMYGLPLEDRAALASRLTWRMERYDSR